jgi:hypothetical protein
VKIDSDVRELLSDLGCLGAVLIFVGLAAVLIVAIFP